MIEQNSEIGATTGTVNPVVGECNDMKLNDIRGRHIQTKHVKEAIQQASADFDEGAVGAGRGMVCYSMSWWDFSQSAHLLLKLLGGWG